MTIVNTSSQLYSVPFGSEEGYAASPTGLTHIHDE